jgi:hypothetical protein
MISLKTSYGNINLPGINLQLGRNAGGSQGKRLGTAAGKEALTGITRHI